MDNIRKMVIQIRFLAFLFLSSLFTIVTFEHIFIDYSRKWMNVFIIVHILIGIVVYFLINEVYYVKEQARLEGAKWDKFYPYMFALVVLLTNRENFLEYTLLTIVIYGVFIGSMSLLLRLEDKIMEVV